MRFNEFDSDSLFQQIADGARAQAAAVNAGADIGRREGAAQAQRYREACIAVAVAYDRAVALDAKLPSSLMAACEAAKRALP